MFNGDVVENLLLIGLSFVSAALFVMLIIDIACWIAAENGNYCAECGKEFNPRQLPWHIMFHVKHKPMLYGLCDTCAKNTHKVGFIVIDDRDTIP